MKRAVLDTSVFVARESDRPLEAFPRGRQVAVSIVTIAELEMGILAAKGAEVRARRLRTLQAAEESEPLLVTRSVAARFAQLAITMREQGQARLKVQDAWIAATALDWDAELWTQDADFAGVPGLRVVQL